MKFLVTTELQENPLLKLLIGFFVGTLMLFICLDILLHHFQIGLTPDLAKKTILGDAEAFMEPLLFDVLLERIHIALFISMLTLLLLTVTYIRLTKNATSKLIHIAFLSAIFAPVSLLLGYFFADVFITLWIGLFILWHLCALYLGIDILWRLLR